jgi:HD-GYP domain-containing protein (c-di-GMP phosphodiesterase class II)
MSAHFHAPILRLVGDRPESVLVDPLTELSIHRAFHERLHAAPAGEGARRLERSQALLPIRALLRAIEAKDPSTREHSERVAALARSLAVSLDWSPERVALLEEAALVHDVGKIGIPDAILRKPGRLDNEEYERVKQHAALGADITTDLLTAEQVAWVRGHHERPDGRGYPDGLRSGDIPGGAAILALADAFDVMTMPRPYGRPRDIEDAVAECAELAGRQFATEPVRALVALAEGSRARQDVEFRSTRAVPPAA